MEIVAHHLHGVSGIAAQPVLLDIDSSELRITLPHHGKTILSTPITRAAARELDRAGIEKRLSAQGLPTGGLLDSPEHIHWPVKYLEIQLDSSNQPIFLTISGVEASAQVPELLNQCKW